jgi:pimeloyl-ACP methyl ester carboxylesterase
MYHSFSESKIFYSDSGSGETIVLLHGYLESSSVWDKFQQSLSSSFRVISVDLPGHGNSDKIEEVHSMELMAEVVKDLMDFLNIDRIFLAGHSLGGYVTLAFLDLFPERLRGYCLFHSHPFPDTQEVVERRKNDILTIKSGEVESLFRRNITRMFADCNLNMFEDEINRLINSALKMNFDGIISVLRGMMIRPSRITLMESGQVPCLWIFGASDNYIQTDVAIKKVCLPANARIVILEHSGHAGFIEEKNKSVEVFNEFISLLDS